MLVSVRHDHLSQVLAPRPRPSTSGSPGAVDSPDAAMGMSGGSAERTVTATLRNQQPTSAGRS